MTVLDLYIPEEFKSIINRAVKKNPTYKILWEGFKWDLKREPDKIGVQVYKGEYLPYFFAFTAITYPIPYLNTFPDNPQIKVLYTFDETSINIINLKIENGIVDAAAYK